MHELMPNQVAEVHGGTETGANVFAGVMGGAAAGVGVASSAEVVTVGLLVGGAFAGVGLALVGVAVYYYFTNEK